MAYIRASQGGGGGGDDGVLLWTNSDPTTNFSNGSIISLSQSVSNFSKIAIDYYDKTLSSDYSKPNKFIIPVEKLLTASSATAGTGALVNGAAGFGKFYGSQYQIRIFTKQYGDDTKLNQYGYGGDIAKCIPLAIYGIA